MVTYVTIYLGNGVIDEGKSTLLGGASFDFWCANENIVTNEETN